MEKQDLVLIPGLALNHRIWGEITPKLEQYANVMVAEPYYSDNIHGMAVDILSKAPDKFALAGISMGGYISMEIMRIAPERVTRVAFLNTNARADSEEASDRRRKSIEFAQKGKYKEVVELSVQGLLSQRAIKETNAPDTIRKMAEEVGLDVFIKQQNAIMTRIDSRESIKDISVPTLVVCGMEDKGATPDVMMEISNAIKGARFVVIEDTGHLSPIESPDEVAAEMIKWLNS